MLCILITQLANSIAEYLIVVVYSRKNVVGLVLECGEVETACKVLGGCNVSTVCAKSETAAQYRKQQNPDNPRSAATIVTAVVATVNSGPDIGQTVGRIHNYVSFQKFIYKRVCTRAYIMFFN